MTSSWEGPQLETGMCKDLCIQSGTNCTMLRAGRLFSFLSFCLAVILWIRASLWWAAEGDWKQRKFLWEDVMNCSHIQYVCNGVLCIFLSTHVFFGLCYITRDKTSSRWRCFPLFAFPLYNTHTLLYCSMPGSRPGSCYKGPSGIYSSKCTQLHLLPPLPARSAWGPTATVLLLGRLGWPLANSTEVF